jgi:hypothetical protein
LNDLFIKRGNNTMVAQLRIYTINKGKLGEFVEGWSKFVYPLHIKHGFKIERAEVIEARNEFIWIVSYDGPDDWDEKQKAYYGSSERAAVDPDPARFIAKTERWMIRSVLPTT